MTFPSNIQMLEHLLSRVEELEARMEASEQQNESLRNALKHYTDAKKQTNSKKLWRK